MLTATKDLMLPTTVTGSWPRPRWYTGNLQERPYSTGLGDVDFREQHLDAVSTVISDQEFAGLDILTNGDYHLDTDLAGRSWFAYPSERLSGVSDYDTESTAGWAYPIGTWLNEIVGGWKYHAIVDKIGPRVPLEFAKIWRVAQSRTEKPVKFGTIASDLASTVLTIQTDVYDDDKRELMWDLATILNAELRQLVAAGCKVVQIEEPAIHSGCPWGADEATSTSTSISSTTPSRASMPRSGSTCWGNPGAQHCFQPSITYEASLEIFLERINADVWTIESKHNGHSLRFGPYKGKLNKKIAVGMISHRALQVETVDEVAADIRFALEHIEPEQLVLSSDCGFGRQGVPRPIALYKAAALAQGANIVREELGFATTRVPAADPAAQIDVPAATPAEVGSS